MHQLYNEYDSTKTNINNSLKNLIKQKTTINKPLQSSINSVNNFDKSTEYRLIKYTTPRTHNRNKNFQLPIKINNKQTIQQNQNNFNTIQFEKLTTSTLLVTKLIFIIKIIYKKLI